MSTVSLPFGDRLSSLAAVPPALVRLGSVAALLLLWWAAVEFDVLQFGKFVSPVTVGVRSVSLAAGEPLTSRTDNSIYVHIFHSLFRVSAGVGTATLLGVPLGILLGVSDYTSDYVEPAVELLRPVPPIAWVPISLLAFSNPLRSIVFIIFVGAFFPIVVNTTEGVRNLDVEYNHAAESLGADRRQVIRHVVVPGALSSVVTGVTIAVGVAWVAVVGAEMIAGEYGVGYVTFQAYRLVDTEVMAVGMMTVGLLGYASAALVRTLGRTLTPWVEQA